MIGLDQQRFRGSMPDQLTLQSRKFQLYSKDFSNVDQAVPLRLLYGQGRFSGVQVTPIFAFHSEPVEADEQKKNGSAPSSYRYWGTLPVAICHGVVNDDSQIELFEITNGETSIWSGSYTRADADSHGKVIITTTVGTIHFYFGSFDQDPSPILSNLEIDLGSGAVSIPTPAWKGVVWALLYNVSFGQQPVPPTLLFRIRRQVAVLPSTEVTQYTDAVVPEVIYDVLTNKRYGAGIDPLDLDQATFEAAAATTIDEGLLHSPMLESQQQLSAFVAEQLQFIDAVLYEQGGKLKLQIVRKAATDSLDVLDESDLLEEPQINPSNFEDTWNQTIVTFTDAENKWERASVAYEDPANAVIVGQTVTKTFDLPAITSQEVALKAATRLGIRGGLPSLFWDIILKPSWKTLLPGDRFKLSYAKLGIEERVVRVRSVTRGGPNSPDIRLTVQEEETRSTDHDYVTPVEDFEIPSTVNDDDGSGDFPALDTTPRISWLPTALKTAGISYPDGFLVACNRPTKHTTGGTVYHGWNGSATTKSGTFTTFPAKAQLVSWHRIGTDSWLFRVRPDSSTDYTWLQTLIESTSQIYAVVGRRDVRTVGTTKSEHQVLSPWLNVVNDGYYDLLTDEVIDVEVKGEAFGTDDLRLESASADGYFPTTHIYFGRLDDFFRYLNFPFYFETNLPNAPRLGDPNLKRYVAVTTNTHKRAQSLSDVTSTFYDRDDTTQCANGTLSRDWGTATPTTYGLFDLEGGLEIKGTATSDYNDVEDIDEAIGKIIKGTETSDQSLKAADIDTVLGSMIATRHKYYAA